MSTLHSQGLLSPFLGCYIGIPLCMNITITLVIKEGTSSVPFLSISFLQVAVEVVDAIIQV